MLLTLRVVLRGISAVPAAWFLVGCGLIQHTGNRGRRLHDLVGRFVVIHGGGCGQAGASDRGDGQSDVERARWEVSQKEERRFRFGRVQLKKRRAGEEERT